MFFRWACFVLIIFVSSSCASTTVQRKSSQIPPETRQDEIQAIQSVVGGVSGKEVSEQDLRKLSADLKKDKDAQAALEAIANPMTQGVHVKYCPVDGKRFSGNLKTCPEQDVELKDVQ